MGSINDNINHRNLLIRKFFRHHLPKDNVRTFGNPKFPAIVVNNQFIANGHVKSIILYMTDGTKYGKTIYSHELLEVEKGNYGSPSQFQDWYHSFPMKRCFKIRVKGTKLYLAGIAYTDQDFNDGHKYPFFAEHEPKIFYNRDYAGTLLTDLFNSQAKLTQKLEIE